MKFTGPAYRNLTLIGCGYDGWTGNDRHGSAL